MTRLKDRLAGSVRRNPATPAPGPKATERAGPTEPGPAPTPAPPARAPHRATPVITRPATGRLGTSAEDTGNRLIVGRQIRLKGEIAACDRLIVEGHVETSIETGELLVLQGGVFIGTASVDQADVRGRIEGNLVARDRLTIHDGGTVVGEIRYGGIVVEDGGILTGDIGKLTEDDKNVGPILTPVAANAEPEPEEAEAP